MAGFHSTFIPSGLQRTSGIYSIRNKVDRKQYIGSAVNLFRRARHHWDELSGNRHNNQRLQRAWNKHGGDQFEFVILEPVTDPIVLVAREQAWMDDLKPEYNINPVAGSRLGSKASPETCKRNGDIHRGRKRSAETCKRIGDGNRGKTLSAEARAKISAAKRGVLAGPMSAAHKANLSRAKKGCASWRKGVSTPPETKAKLSASLKGNTNGRGGKGRKHSEATKLAWSIKRKGRKLSPEHIAKTVATRKARGYRHSEATKAKILEGLRKHFHGG